MKILPSVQVALLFVAMLPVSAELGAVRVASGLTQPLYVTAPADDPSRLFIVEQGGLIKIRDQSSGAVLAQPFLDLTSQVTLGAERGLLGLTFHPDYANNGRFYVHYNDLSGNTRVEEYTHLPGNLNQADPASARTIITISRPSVNHNAGWMDFGPNEGFLYVATGESGNDDQFNLAQNMGVLQGKLLRLDVSQDAFPGDADRNYAIPPTNPFAATPGVAPEIWASGLRHPWRNSFDLLTGDLYIADVGQTQREEIDFQSADSLGGENYGWRPWEGTIPNPDVSEPKPAGAVDPIFEYDHTVGRSIVGGYVYRGTEVPEADGLYFFADFISSQVWTLRYDGIDVTELTERTGELAPEDGLDLQFISSFGQDALGELYLVDYADGEVFQLVTESVPETKTLGPVMVSLVVAGLFGWIRHRVRRGRGSRLISSQGMGGSIAEVFSFAGRNRDSPLRSLFAGFPAGHFGTSWP